MRNLIVVNSTRQNFVFSIRNAETGRLYRLDVPSGRQRELTSREWSEDQIMQWVQHLDTHGARPHDDSGHDMTGFLGISYRFGAPVSTESIESANVIADETLNKRSAAEAMKGVMAADMVINQGGRGKRLAQVTEVEVKQDIGRREKPTGKEVVFQMSVDPEANAPLALPA